MTKYKIVGIANIILGIIGILVQGNTLFFVYPRMLSLYADFGAQVPFITQAYSYISLFLILILAFVVFIGARLTFGKNEKLFKIGLFLLIFILIFIFVFYALLFSSIIFPLYNLSFN